MQTDDSGLSDVTHLFLVNLKKFNDPTHVGFLSERERKKIALNIRSRLEIYNVGESFLDGAHLTYYFIDGRYDSANLNLSQGNRAIDFAVSYALDWLLIGDSTEELRSVRDVIGENEFEEGRFIGTNKREKKFCQLF